MIDRRFPPRHYCSYLLRLDLVSDPSRANGLGPDLIIIQKLMGWAPTWCSYISQLYNYYFGLVLFTRCFQNVLKPGQIYFLRKKRTNIFGSRKLGALLQLLKNSSFLLEYFFTFFFFFYNRYKGRFDANSFGK